MNGSAITLNSTPLNIEKDDDSCGCILDVESRGVLNDNMSVIGSIYVLTLSFLLVCETPFTKSDVHECWVMNCEEGRDDMLMSLQHLFCFDDVESSEFDSNRGRTRELVHDRPVTRQRRWTRGRSMMLSWMTITLLNIIRLCCNTRHCVGSTFD